MEPSLKRAVHTHDDAYTDTAKYLMTQRTILVYIGSLTFVPNEPKSEKQVQNTIFYL